MSEKEKIIKTFSNLKIVVDIEVNDQNEDDEQDSGKAVIFRIKKEKNKDFFKLRDFFKAGDETFTDERGITRYKYKKILINKLYSYSSYTYKFLQAGDEIVVYGYSVDDFRTIKSYLNDFLSALKFCYEQIFNQGSYEIKVDLV